jgi:hypothetical protein
MSRRARSGIVILALTHLAFANASSALAQAGSAGGTIGKQDKSVSGGEDHSARRNSQPRRRSTSASAESTACGSIRGLWSWVGVISTQVIFNSDHSIDDTSGHHGSWTCTGGLVVVSWTNGYVDRLALSTDHSQLTGNAGLGGIPITVTRR